MPLPARVRPGTPSSEPVLVVGRTYAIAAFLLLAPFLTGLLAAAGFAAGLSVTPAHLPVALASAAMAAWWVARAELRSPRDAALDVAIGLVILAVALAVADPIWDLSYDGQAYHQSSIRLLASGWNPVRHALTTAETTHGLWLDHYVRAVELGAATVTAATGSVEAGKGFGLGLLVSAALLTRIALRRAGAGAAAALGAAVLLVVNPIVISQLPTFYVDGQLALVFACALALALLSLPGGTRSAPWLLAAALALLANVKFTATVYAALLLAGYSVVALRADGRRAMRRVATTAALTLALTLGVAWQPLVTNTLEHGHPFHPVAGPQRHDGLSGQTPPFRHRDPLRRLVESTFAESDATRSTPVPKLPWTVRSREIAAMEVPDVRLGGFGPLFALAVLLVVGGIAKAPWRRGAGARAGLLVAAGILMTVLVNPGAWWARFVPQLWIAVALAAVAVAADRRARLLGIAAAAVLAADAGLVGVATVRNQIDTQRAALEQAHALGRTYGVVELPRGEMEALDLRLARVGVRARYVARCAPTRPLVGTYALYCDRAAPAASPP